MVERKIITTILFTLCVVYGYTQYARINNAGQTVNTRINAPTGYKRTSITAGSFGEYLRQLKLKPHLSKVLLYDGTPKYNQDAHLAVVRMDIGNRNLQQCADAIMRLRAEYLYKQKQYQRIHFKFTNGFVAIYSKWKDGYRIKVSGNKVTWVKTAKASTDYVSFRKYLDIVFTYAGTLSLEKELIPVQYSDIRIGDVFIKGGSPGHAVMVVDMAINKSGRKVFLLAQSYMPAQEIQILKNPDNENLSPWYDLSETDILLTPEWTFSKLNLKRFTD